jgi:hypothetical protein
MDKNGLSELRLACKRAVTSWIETIRAEESLATTYHSMTAMERWDDAHFKEQDAQTKAQQARDAYKDAFRKANYGI